MKLYATITNEKGKEEGMGGNESLTIEINRGNRRMIELYLTIDPMGDDNELVVLDMLNLSDGNTTRIYEYEVNRSLPEYKQGKKQKGERVVCCNQCHKPLTAGELKEYPIQWQYSGDMYCNKHK